MKVVAVCLLHTKLIWHQRYSQLWHRVVWQICNDISDRSITLILEATGSPQTMLHIYQLTVAGLRWQAPSLSPPWELQITFYMTLNKYFKSWSKSDWYDIVNSISNCCMGARSGAFGWDTVLQVVDSISSGVIGIFHWHNPSGHTMDLGLTHPQTEMSTRNISWG